ncbi:hypothetical protein TREES_T100006638 [Tupaia chinensis]|uniref:Uncharacterized protein n=1 Tax=Tupaia chinensis TaxID=246437 RepID=L9KN92_TUPCH|nr:hypothetical protein TREES_T100006638 [Tupaia chinensis]
MQASSARSRGPAGAPSLRGGLGLGRGCGPGRLSTLSTPRAMGRRLWSLQGAEQEDATQRPFQEERRRSWRSGRLQIVEKSPGDAVRAVTGGFSQTELPQGSAEDGSAGLVAGAARGRARRAVPDDRVAHLLQAAVRGVLPQRGLARPRTSRLSQHKLCPRDRPILLPLQPQWRKKGAIIPALWRKYFHASGHTQRWRHAYQSDLNK